MSLAQGFPSTFSNTEETREVLHNLDNETKKIYTDVNNIMAAGGHAHTGNGNDGAPISLADVTISTAINENMGSAIASASTIDLTNATGNFLHITGTITITAVTLGAGMRREVIFDNILTLTHHATNNNLPGAANITTASGDRASYYSDGTTVYCTKYVKANGTSLIGTASIVGQFKNLKINSLGANNYNVVITADEVALENSANNYMTVRAVSKTVNMNGTVGSPLSIMSTRAASTWYYPWLWYNATNGLTATMDVSSTSPTAPTGYTSADFKALLPGARRTDSSGGTYPLQISTSGNKSHYVVTAGTNITAMPQMATGSAGSISTPTWVAVSVSNFIPPVAYGIGLVVSHAGLSGGVMVAPNNSFGTNQSTTNPPPMGVSAVYPNQIKGVLFLESTNIYWAADAGASAAVYCYGWEE